MRTRARHWLAVLVAAAAAWAASPAMGDGKYFRTQVVARDPSIPHQAALISYRDGIETLVVQSAVQAEGEHVAWVLPLPAQPTAIEAASPGTIATLQQLVQPRLVLERNVTPWIFVALAALACCGMMLVVSRALSKHSAWARILIYVIAFPCVLLATSVGVLFPTLVAKPRSMAAANAQPQRGVSILTDETVGSYTVTVIAAEAGSEVRDWLSENGFACDDAAGVVIDRYVAEGWCFATAKIRWSPGQTLSPHPLKVVFPVDEAVYPMRLTGAGATQPLALDLFIIGSEMAAARDLKQWRCERLVRDAAAKNWFDEDAIVYEGDLTQLRIGHPVIAASLWDGATLTHLSGMLSPAQMARDDVQLRWEPARPYHRTFFIGQAATLLGGVVGIGLAALAFLAASLAALRTSWRFGGVCRWTLAPGLAVAAFCAPAFALLAPSVETATEPHHPIDRKMAQNHVMYEWDDLRERGALEREQFIARLRTEWPEHLPRGDVPMGLDIREDDSGWDLIFHDRDATPTVMRLDREPPG
ncbi:MAG: DUF2330 domain-containing protein [Phycisphaerales bacterium]|nr:DUF2330 domain-containing protein [Phycisphaerales bacterium]